MGSQAAPWFVRLWRPLRRRTLRRAQQLKSIEVRGAEPVRKALDEGAGVLITPNHSFHYDSYVLMEAVEQLGRLPYIMSAWQVFAQGGRFQSWVMQKHGCFSIDREGADMRAFRLAVDLLEDVFGVVQLFSYPGNYVAERSSGWRRRSISSRKTC